MAGLPLFVDPTNPEAVKQLCLTAGYLDKIPREIYWFLYALVALFVLMLALYIWLLKRNPKTKEMFSNLMEEKEDGTAKLVNNTDKPEPNKPSI